MSNPNFLTEDIRAKKERIEKGEQGEADLSKWLAASCLSYVAICQARETFAPMFTGEVKRPDFLVLLDSVGLIAVDAKNFAPKEYDGQTCYTMTLESELKRSIAFERVFRMPLWYAYRNNEDDGESWHWISALKAIEVGTRRDGQWGPFLSIEHSHFAHVRIPDDIAKLYTQRLPGVARIAALPMES